MKTCGMCKTEKEITEFYRRNNYTKSKTNTVYYKTDCKVCDIKRTQQWKTDNREKWRKYHREYEKNRKLSTG